EVEVFVRIGGVIRGSIVDAHGAPQPEKAFGSASANGSQWAPGRRRRTRPDGTFEIIGLSPGWYLVAPDPHGKEVFTYERVEVNWGTVHELTLEELPRRTTRIELRPEGIEVDEPWPFSVYAWVTRDDLMTLESSGRVPTEIYQERYRSPGLDLAGPVTIERELAEGPYRIHLTARTAPGDASEWFGAPWTQACWFDVDDLGAAHFRASGETNRITLTGMENVAIVDGTIAGPASALWLYWQRPVGESAGDWRFDIPSVREDANGARSFGGAMDLSQVHDRQLRFHEKVRREPMRLIDTIDLVRGRNEIALQFQGHLDER
ncbi:MAG: carboxypeptidase-like regulatory domain-containing protein, partial [Planctomycetota bacterium]